MVLEAVVLCLDNSDWSRNGDYQPTRWDSQEQAVNLICEGRLESNPENAMGLISMGGKRVEVHATLTHDGNRLMKAAKNVEINGDSCDLITSMSIGFLTLKHRQNKNQKQRIIAFVGSPLTHAERDLALLARKLKKNNIAVDVISFGNVDENRAKLDKFISQVNNNNNSSLVEIPQGYYVVDYLLSTPIMSSGMDYGQMEGGNQPAGGQENPGMSQFEKDLQSAMQASLSESKPAEQKKEEKVEEKPVEKKPEQTPGKTENPGQKAEETVQEPDFENMTEEQIIEQAMKMSLMEQQKKKETDDKKEEETNEVLNNPDFVKELLEEVGEEGDDEKVDEVLKKVNKKDDK